MRTYRASRLRWIGYSVELVPGRRRRAPRTRPTADATARGVRPTADFTPCPPGSQARRHTERPSCTTRPRWTTDRSSGADARGNLHSAARACAGSTNHPKWPKSAQQTTTKRVEMWDSTWHRSQVGRQAAFFQQLTGNPAEAEMNPVSWDALKRTPPRRVRPSPAPPPRTTRGRSNRDAIDRSSVLRASSGPRGGSPPRRIP